MEKLMIDSDVVINWLAKEEETNTGSHLWIAPSTILELGEKGQLTNHISLLSVFEVRFVLRRKKRMAWLGIEEDLKAIRHILQFLTPGQSELEQADHLQREHSLDPFDSIILAQTIFLKGTLITRDRTLLEIAESFVPCFTPEKFLDHCMDDQVND